MSSTIAVADQRKAGHRLERADQTYSNIQQILVDALVDYDTYVIPASVLPFFPIAPLTKCP